MIGVCELFLRASREIVRRGVAGTLNLRALGLLLVCPPKHEAPKHHQIKLPPTAVATTSGSVNTVAKAQNDAAAAVEPLTPAELKQMLEQSKKSEDDDCLMCGS